jgi:hypothetical protein
VRSRVPVTRTATGSPATTEPTGAPSRPWGGIALAAVLMILSGLATFFVGITGIIRESFFAG